MLQTKKSERVQRCFVAHEEQEWLSFFFVCVDASVKRKMMNLKMWGLTDALHGGETGKCKHDWMSL